jgi:hypothetical protein
MAKGIRYVSAEFFDPQNRRPTVNLFAQYPMDFEILYRDSLLLPLSGTNVRIASVAHLITIKQAAGRPKDLEDVKRLAELSETRSSP